MRDPWTPPELPPQKGDWVWPAMVIALLVLSVGVGTSLLVAAHLMDDGPQVEENYYARAVDWESHRGMVERGLALGWRIDVRPEAERVLVQVRDRDGAPVDEVSGRLSARRSSESTPRLQGELLPLDDGALALEGSLYGTGLWDFFVDLQDAEGETARFELRRELR